MSDLATRLIAEAQADCDSRMETIEAHAGLIEGADALAATLRVSLGNLVQAQTEAAHG